MAGDDQATNDKPPAANQNPFSLDEADRLADQFTASWEDPNAVAAPARPPAAPPVEGTAVPAPVPVAPAPAPLPPLQAGSTAPAIPAVMPAPAPSAIITPVAVPTPAAPGGGMPLGQKTVLGLAPPVIPPAAPEPPPPAFAAVPAPAARPPSEPPEEPAPDSKAEYAPPRALPQAQRTMLGLAPPVSVAPSAGADAVHVSANSGMHPGAVSSQRAAPTQAAVFGDEEDRSSARIDTVPPRSRRQRSSRGVVFGVMGVAALLVALGVGRQLMGGTKSETGSEPSHSRTDGVTAAQAPAAAPPAPATAAPEPAPPPPAEDPPATTKALDELKEPEKEPPTARPAAVAPVARRREPEPAHPQRVARRVAPAPARADRRSAHASDSPRPAAPSPPPAAGGGAIVRDTPF